ALVTRAHQERVRSYIESGIDEGARIVATAPVPSESRLANGFWVEPTLFADVTPDLVIAQEEIFGPVSAVTRFNGEDEAVAIANGTPYGLVAGVYTSDSVRANRTARRLDAGVVMVNNYYRAYLGSPFGGVKGSGYGREHAMESLREFVYSKNVREPSGFGEIPDWSAVDAVF